MGRSIDLYSYDYEKLVNKILTVCNTNDRALIEKIILSCGNKIADRYIILHQEMWENDDCYFNVSTALEKVFNVEDVFEDIFSSDWESVDKKRLIRATNLDEIWETIRNDINCE